MNQIFEALTFLLPQSLDEEQFSDPNRRQEVLDWMGVLADSSTALGRHAEERDVDFRNLSHALARDVSELQERYRMGQSEGARYFITGLTRYCVTCHSRLANSQNFPLAQKLIAKIDMKALPFQEQTQILVATRQFDLALAQWESFFEAPDVTPTRMDVGGYLLDYLTVGIRVRRAPARVAHTLEKLAERKDTPIYLSRRLKIWASAVKTLTPALKAPQNLKKIQRLIHHPPGDSPLDREQLIYDLVASALILDYIDRSDDNDPNLAEVYYLLALAESRSVDTYWIPQTEFHLEVAIQLDPGGPFAKDAYALLEEHIAIGYGGVLNEETIPLDVWSKLQELQLLINAHPAPQFPRTGETE